MTHDSTTGDAGRDGTEPGAAMTSRERRDLAQLVRRREKVAKSATRQRAAELTADVEAQLSAEYGQDDARWATVTAAARVAVAKADAEVERICVEIGVPPEFRPGLHLGWYGRGQNASASRRNELRRVATTRIEALEAAARAEIERRSVEVQTELLAGGLTSSDARAFLLAMPGAEQLMPTMPLGELEAAVPLHRPREPVEWPPSVP